MTTCSSCGHNNEDHYKYCLGCGASLEEQRQSAAPAGFNSCPSCGGEISVGQRFCGSCGFKLETDSAPAPAPAPEPVASTNQPVASLVLLNPDRSLGEEIPLYAGDNVVGRATGHDLFGDDPLLSPEHANFHVTGTSVVVRDLESTHGIYYQIEGAAAIRSGYEVCIGEEVIQYFDVADDERMIPPVSDGLVGEGTMSRPWGRLSCKTMSGSTAFGALIRTPEFTIGREVGDLIFHTDGYMSGRHLRFYRDGQTTWIEDLRSSNGTFIRIDGERALEDGAQIRMGTRPFRIVFK